MGVIITGAAGLCLWIILWSLGMSGFDAILIALVMVIVAVAVQTVAPQLTRRRNGE